MDPRRFNRHRLHRNYSFDTPMDERTNAGMRTETVELRIIADEKIVRRNTAERAGAWSRMLLLRAARAATV
jgi:hypothetical protein